MAEVYPVSMNPRLTDRGLHVIKQWERFRAKPYGDGFDKNGKHVYSIGYGHSSLMDTYLFDADTVWTEEAASQALLSDLDYFSNLLLPHLKVPVPDTIWSVCLSLAYNKGASRLVKSDVWARLNSQDGYDLPFDRFCEDILTYAVEAPDKLTGVIEPKRGLRWRRVAEAAIHLQDRFKDYL